MKTTYLIDSIDYFAGDVLARIHGACSGSVHGHHDVVRGETACRLCGADRIKLPTRCAGYPACSLEAGNAGECRRVTRAGLEVSK